MAKRGKKKSGKKPEDVFQSTQQSDHPAGASRQGLAGHTVDLSFFRSSAQLYGELHQHLSHVGGEGYTEEIVSHTGRQILRALDDLAQALDPRSRQNSSCPFVMLLSMLLPTLRKYLKWTQATRSLWGSNFLSLRHQSITPEGTVYRAEDDTVLWAMLAQHNILTQFTLQIAHILRLIDTNEGADHDGCPKITTHQSTAHQPSSHASSAASSACSSVASTPRDPMESGGVYTPRVTSDQPVSIPQIHRISVELANVDAECKIHLAKLTECLVEVVEMVSSVLESSIYSCVLSQQLFVQIARHMCSPTASKDAGKSRISAVSYRNQIPRSVHRRNIAVLVCRENLSNALCSTCSSL